MFEDTAGEGTVGQVRAHDFAAVNILEAGYERVEAIKALDVAIRQAQAEQLVQIAALHRERCSVMQLGDGDPGLSVAGEVGMARNISPGAAGNQLATALGVQHMPEVFGLFRSGRISEQVAKAVVRETAALSPDDLVVADAELARIIVGLGPVQAGRAAAKVVIELDAEAAHERAVRARADVRVELRPCPDGVSELWVRGPAEKLTAAFKTLEDWALGLRATGDPRTRPQIMLDTLVERVTGTSTADHFDVEIQLVMDAQTLLAGGESSVELVGHGPIAPDVADDLIAAARNATVRRLLTDPVDGSLAARETRRRLYTGSQRDHVKTRDRYCRQPGCECGIREADHIRDVQWGGTTTLANAQGLCKASHLIKHQPGFSVRTDGKTTIWRTPSGHEYRSSPPRQLGHLRQ